VHNGINVHRFDGYIDPAICRARYGIGPLDPMALFAGRLSIQKGPDLLLEAIPGALNSRHDAKFVFVGDGHMRGDLERRAHELGVAHAVRFLGAMGADGDLVNLFKATDVVVVPSRNEPFGIVILEGWAAGKPVIATHNGGPREFVTHGQEGYLVYDNPGSICWGLNEIFCNFEQARWMGERGRVKAAYTFSWDRIAEHTENVYRELL
jgi:glycosyltransferase involved in cell wall biosynthesis